jgi:His/Glu/Gln/Arg/opine family amino acid ABC transporter permease subunit
MSVFRSLLLFLAVVALLGQARAEEPLQEPLSLAMSGAFQPFSTTDARGRLVGFDADVAREVARRMGRTPVLVQAEWAGIQAGLQAGKFDLICGSMAITPDRVQSLDFTLPYYVSGAQVFVRSGRGSLKGARVGVTEDSTYTRYIRDHPELFGQARILVFGSEAEIVAACNTDKVDAFVSDRIVGGFYLQQGRAVDIVPRGGLLYREACAIAAPKGSPELVRQVNLALLSMVQDGTYSELYRHWVGQDPDLGALLQAWSEHVSLLPLDLRPLASGRRARFAEEVPSMLSLLGQGALLTLRLSLLTALLALLTGTLAGLAAVSRSRILRAAAAGYILLVRGTPLLVQLFLAYFGVATLVNHLTGVELVGAFGAALAALVVNAGAYNAETLRGAILAVDRGQWDAAASLGMVRSVILRRIILPQAFRDSLPSLGNNMVVLIKDTSLVGAITLVELTYSARNIVFQTGQAFLPFILAALLYLVLITGLSAAVRSVELRLGRSRGRRGGVR